jgi:hypothetical protein
LCLFLHTQNNAGGKILQFIGASPAVANILGTTPAASNANAATLYIFWFDGIDFWLVDYTSFAASGSYVGRFTDSASIICGDNISRKFAFLSALYNFYMIASGTNTYTASSGNVANYQFGTVYTVNFTNANTGAATLQINSLAVLPIQRREVAVTAGQIPALSTLQFVFDGAAFQMLGAA